MTVATLTLLAPAWLWALLPAVGGPLLAHLLSRRRAVSAMFPTIRFLREAVEHSRRQVRLRDRMLLLLRCVILALIVLAFARPAWEQATLAETGEENGRHIVILLDRSASMNRTGGGATLFEKARVRAMEAINAMDPGRDVVSVILVDSRPSLLAGEPTASVSSLRPRLRDVEPTWQRASADRAIDLARLQLDRDRPGPGQSPRRRVVEVFSDFQQTAWSPGALTSLGREAHVRLHRIEGPESNLAISGPRVMPARPLAGFESIVSVEVSNLAAEGRTATVTIEGGDEPVTRVLDLHAGESRRIGLTIEISDPGIAKLTASVEPADGFTADNETGLFVEVAEARRVAVVTENTDQPGRAAAMVMEALAPQWWQQGVEDEGKDDDGQQPAPERAAGDYRSGPISPVSVATVATDDLASLLTGEGPVTVPDMLVLCGAGELSGQAMRAMGAFLRAGGGGIWIVDSPAAANALAAMGEDDRLGIRPPLQADNGFNVLPESDDWPGLVVGDGDDPLVQLLRESGLHRGLAAAKFGAVFDAVAAEHAETLLRFENGRPALAASRIGSGRLTVLAGDLHPQRNRLVNQRLFAVLMQELAHGHGGGETTPAPPRPGQALNLHIPGMEGPEGTAGTAGVPGDGRLHYRLLGPDGDTLASGELEPQQRRIEAGRAGRPGPYSVTVEETGRIAGTWVELDPTESDFRPVLPEALADQAPDTADDEQEQAASPETAAGRTPTGSVAIDPASPQRYELWPWLLAAVLLLAALELMILRLSAARSRQEEISTTVEESARAA